MWACALLALLLTLPNLEAQEGTAAGHEAAEPGKGHAEQANPNEIWWRWLNFALLAGGLGYLGAKHIGPYFHARSEEIKKGIAEATAMRAEAEARARDMEARVENLSGELEATRQAMRAEFQAEGERMRAEMGAQLTRMRAQAEAEIEAAGRAAAHSLKAYTAELSLELAEQQIRQQLTPEVRAELTHRFADELARKVAVN